jgi:hypothetical protein
MNLWKLLLFGVAGWSAVGMLGVAVSLTRGERARVMRGVAWIVGIWVIYLAALVGTSLAQRQRALAIGQEQCFDKMCFAVIKVEEVPGFLIHDGSHLIRVQVQMRNRSPSNMQSDALIRAYLVDAQGRRWEESAGVSGVRLTARVGPGDIAVSEPVFKVASDATGLELVFTRGWKQPGTLVIGDSDSILHRKTVATLGR